MAGEERPKYYGFGVLLECDDEPAETQRDRLLGFVNAVKRLSDPYSRVTFVRMTRRLTPSAAAAVTNEALWQHIFVPDNED